MYANGPDSASRASIVFRSLTLLAPDPSIERIFLKDKKKVERFFLKAKAHYCSAPTTRSRDDKLVGEAEEPFFSSAFAFSHDSRRKSAEEERSPPCCEKRLRALATV